MQKDRREALPGALRDAARLLTLQREERGQRPFMFRCFEEYVQKT